jgi:1A family penicillin-binding protein
MLVIYYIAKIGHILLFPFEKLIPFIYKKFRIVFSKSNTDRATFSVRFVRQKIITKTNSFIRSRFLMLKSFIFTKLQKFIEFSRKIRTKITQFKPKNLVKKSKQIPKEVYYSPVTTTNLPAQVHKRHIFEYLLKFLIRLFNLLKTFFKYFIIYSFGFISAVLLLLLPYQVYLWWSELPSPDLLLTDSYSKTTKIYDRNDQLLYEIYVDKNYNPVKLDQIPQSLVDATISAEDSQFYNHVGFRPESIMRAAYKIWKKEEVQGGSTITQQLIKNVLLSSERTLQRKVKELVLAVLVESKYSKQQILELYLNNIPYGGEAWGVESASKKYFGKDVWELSLAESALLAGLPSSPTTYSPLIDPTMAKQRQKYVLDRMVETGYLSKEEADAAFAEELLYKTDTNYMRAPHFVDYVRKDLEKKYGKRFVELGGLTIKTTLDVNLQDKVQKIVTDGVENNQRLNISNGAAVVLDSQNAEILAYVGSVDYYKENWGAYDVASAYRQPGSSIKPVTYALALANGYTPATIIKDSPVTFQIRGGKPYTPVNYDGKFHGNVTLRSALANSYNIPAVRLAQAFGPDNVVALGRQMGLTNWEVDGSYGLSVTLGGKEVRLVDLTNTYATFARRGTYKELTPYLSIKDGRGFEIYTGTPKIEQKALTEEVSYLIWHILSDNIARLPAFGTQNFLSLQGRSVAVKTGTTDLKRDNWTLGFTPSYTVGVWVGNNDNKPMNPYLASGLSGAAPIWNGIFNVVTEGKPDEPMVMPNGVFVRLYKECGNKSEVFIKGSTIPSNLCEKVEDKKKKDK